MNSRKHLRSVLHLIAATLWLTGCASHPPPPDWQANAFSALHAFSQAHLVGNTQLANAEFARATAELARTGRADLRARAELMRCAVRLASLENDQCANYTPWAAQANPSDQAYAAFLRGQWSGINVALLPEHHRAVVRNGKNGSINLGEIKDPLGRLVAAGALLQYNAINPSNFDAVIDAASAQGWRRPLLAWLSLQRERMRAAGQHAQANQLQERINIVLQTPLPLNPSELTGQD